MKLLSIFLLIGFFSTNVFSNTNTPKLMRMVCYGVKASDDSTRTGSVMVIEQVNNAVYDGRVFADPESDEFQNEITTNSIPFKLKYYQNVSNYVTQSNGNDEVLIDSLSVAESSNSVQSETIDWVGYRGSTSLTSHNYVFMQEDDRANSLIVLSGKETQVQYRNESWFDTFDCKTPFMVDAPVVEPEIEDQTADASDLFDAEEISARN